MEAIANVTYFLGFYPKFDDQTTPSAKFTLVHEMATYYELYLEVPLLPRPPPQLDSTRLDSTRLNINNCTGARRSIAQQVPSARLEMQCSTMDAAA